MTWEQVGRVQIWPLEGIHRHDPAIGGPRARVENMSKLRFQRIQRVGRGVGFNFKQTLYGPVPQTTSHLINRLDYVT